MISLLSSGPRSAASATAACVATTSPAARGGKWRGRGRGRLLDAVSHIALDGVDRGLSVGWREGAAADKISRARHHQPEIGGRGAAPIAVVRVGVLGGRRTAPIRAR